MSNDVLAEAVGQVMRELRNEDEDDEGKTFRAVMTERFGAFRAELNEVKAQQNQLFWVVVGGVLANVLLNFGSSFLSK